MKKYNRNSKYTYKSTDLIIANTNNLLLKQKLIMRKQLKGLMVIVLNGRLLIAIKRLKRKLKNDGRLDLLKLKRQYKKPSIIKKLQRRKSRLKHKYSQMQNKNNYLLLK